MKRILINATHNEEIRVALCKGNHLYDFDLENRTREQKKSNIYKGHVTRVEPSLEAVFVEYGSQRQGFLPIREIANEYLKGNPRDENIRKLIKEGDELIVQVEKEERGNKGAALSTYISLAGRYLVLMPNNPRGGGISRQISGKLREDMKRMLGNLDLPKGMSVIIRTAGIGKTQEDLQHDLNHLLNIWQAIQEQNQNYPSPRLVHQEAGVVTRAVRDYLRDDITEIWIDNENAYIEAAGFIDAVMPKQADKLRKYTDFEPMFARFGIEKQIETAYQREVRLPSGGSIVIDQTEALVSIDINSAKSTKGSDVAETAYHTNLEAADEIARQLRLRDMGGLIVIDFIDMNDSKHQKEVEKRLIEATKYDRARVQFGDISRFGLMEMSRQRLRPSLEESTGYICPRCHGNGMIRDLRSLSLSIMRQIERIALKERQGEVQAEVPTDIAAFLLNEKRDSLVYLEQDSGTRITILPHAHLESPNFKLHFNRDGFAPSSYERITDTQQQESSDLGYDVDWQTADKERPEQQPTRQPRATNHHSNTSASASPATKTSAAANPVNASASTPAPQADQKAATATSPHAVAWLSNLFAPTPQATTVEKVNSQSAAQAIEAIVNSGAQSLGALGQVDIKALNAQAADNHHNNSADSVTTSAPDSNKKAQEQEEQDKRRRKSRKNKSSKPRHRKDKRADSNKASAKDDSAQADLASSSNADNKSAHNRRDANSRRESRGEMPRGKTLTPQASNTKPEADGSAHASKPNKGDHSCDNQSSSQKNHNDQSRKSDAPRRHSNAAKSPDVNEVTLQVNEAPQRHKTQEVVHLCLDDTNQDSSAANNTKSANEPSDHQQKSAASAETKKAIDPQIAANQSSSSDRTTTSADSVKSQQPHSADHLDTADSKPKSAPTDSALPADQTLASDEQSNSEQASTTAEHAAMASSEADADNKADLTPQYDHATIFADRYITAKRFGQANNDPRVVKAQQASSLTSPPAPAQTIRGSVGEFIHSMLPNAKAQLESQGVIASFIQAMQTLQLESSKSAADAASASLDITAFDFSNFGYAALDADYLGRFNQMTQAVRQVATEQGKTAVAPRPITRRASNDPRGQHPDYQDPESTTATNASTDNSSSTKTSTSSDMPSRDATALTSQPKSAYVAQESESLLDHDAKIAANLTDHHNQADTTSTPSAKSEDGRDESKDDHETASKESAGSSKTTVASYKNMIENVAEQLLPQQTNLFNLTTPKVPKSRSRKSKSDHKKPTQSERHSEDNADK